MTMTFDMWEARTRLALARVDINHLTADPLIEDAKAHWENSGQDPLAALGSPQEFAVAAAAEQPAAVKAVQNREGTTATEYFSGMIFALGVLVIPWSLVLAVGTGSFSFALTPARAAGGLLFVLSFLSLYALPDSLRAAGRPDRAPWAYVPTFILIGLTVAAFTLGPETRLITVPVLALDAVAAFVAWTTIRPAKASDPSAESALMVGPDDVETWFRRLNGLLIGRHDLPPARAAELVEEARGHLTGTSATEEFGQIEIYAAELAEPETTRQIPWWHGRAFRNLLFAGFVAVLGRETILRWWNGGDAGRDLGLLGLGFVVLVTVVRLVAGQVAARRRSGTDR